MAFVGFEPREAPNWNTFIHYLPATHGCRARASSVPGYTPFWVKEKYAAEPPLVSSGVYLPLLKRRQCKVDASLATSDSESTDTPGSSVNFEFASECSVTPAPKTQEGLDMGTIVSNEASGADESQQEESQKTTVMVRNLPSAMSQTALMHEMKQTGFDGLFDFLYMPSDFNRRSNKGYAFVNFKSNEACEWFIESWHGTRFSGYHHSALNICLAEVQGRYANFALWNTSSMQRIRNANYRPLIVDDEDSLVAVSTAPENKYPKYPAVQQRTRKASDLTRENPRWTGRNRRSRCTDFE